MGSEPDFRFSPRPNRAAEVAWRPWGEPAFEEARRLGRPILLSLSAVWCHWCHVMDETSYSDPRVIAAANQHFVAIRVDNDRHPDVNRRYNMGGWPTTAFLTPAGEILTGATYLPPDQMLDSLHRVRTYFDANRVSLDVAASERTDATAAGAPPDPGEHLLGTDRSRGPFAAVPGSEGDIADDIALQIVRAFDPVSGGLGSSPKFPQADVFAFMLAYAVLRKPGDGRASTGGRALEGSSRVREVVTTTLRRMAGGGIYDAVAGGFFRYATRRDWSVPHYEKMLEDNARLAALYVEAAEVGAAHGLGDRDAFLHTSEGVLDYLLTTLWRGDVAAFGGSQDADEEYYAADAQRRARRDAPLVDTTVYVDWNAQAVRALLRAAPALGRPALVNQAVAVLDFLLTSSREGEAMAHFVLPDGETGGGTPLLSDQIWVAAALLDAYEVTAERRWLESAEALAGWACERLRAPDGRLHDRLIVPGESAGLLSTPVPALEENALAADVLLRLEAYTGRVTYREQADDLLAAWVTHYGRYGVAAAGYGQALLRSLERPDHLVIVGRRDDQGARRLQAAALTSPRPLRTVQLLDPSDPADAARIEEAGYAGAAPGEAAVAYVCRGHTCARFQPHEAEMPPASRRTTGPS